jgi:hypothetical protein
MCRCLWQWAIGAVSKLPISSEIHFCHKNFYVSTFPWVLPVLGGRQLFLRELSFQVPLGVVAHPQISVSVLFHLPLSCFLF